MNPVTKKPVKTTDSKTEVAKAKASEAASAMSDKVGHVADDAKHQAGKVQQRVRTQALNKADDRKDGLVEQGKEIGRETDKIAEQLRRDGKDMPARLLEQAGTRIESVVSYAETHPMQEMLDDATRLARRSPMTYIGAAFGLGFAASRLLKATPDEDEQLALPRTGTTYGEPLGTAPGGVNRSYTGSGRPL